MKTLEFPKSKMPSPDCSLSHLLPLVPKIKFFLIKRFGDSDQTNRANTFLHIFLPSAVQILFVFGTLISFFLFFILTKLVFVIIINLNSFNYLGLAKSYLHGSVTDYYIS